MIILPHRYKSYLQLQTILKASQFFITKHKNANGTTIISVRNPDGTFRGDAGQLLNQLNQTDLVFDKFNENLYKRYQKFQDLIEKVKKDQSIEIDLDNLTKILA